MCATDNMAGPRILRGEMSWFRDGTGYRWTLDPGNLDLRGEMRGVRAQMYLYMSTYCYMHRVVYAYTSTDHNVGLQQLLSTDPGSTGRSRGGDGEPRSHGTMASRIFMVRTNAPYIADATAIGMYPCSVPHISEH